MHYAKFQATADYSQLKGITICVRRLLQIASTELPLSTKMLQPLLQNAATRRKLLQNDATFITKCVSYYKMMQPLLQSA